MTESETEFKISGLRLRPAKLYRTCTFQGLRLRKDEFLSRIVKAMEAKGFRKEPPIEPFDVSLKAKDVINIREAGKLAKKASRHLIAGSDILLLGEEKKGIKYPRRIAMRVEERGNDLRFGYFYFKEFEKVKSVKGMLSVIELVAEIAILFGGTFLVLLTLGKSLGFWACVFLVCITVFPLFLLLSMYRPYIKPWRIEKEIGRRMVEVAEAMGGKQLTPFKKTTVKLEG